MAEQYPQVTAEFRRYLEGLLDGPLPVRYKHQPDTGDSMTLRSFLQKRQMSGH